MKIPTIIISFICYLFTPSNAQANATNVSSVINITSAIRCYDTQCQNREIVCTNQFGTCFVYCQDPRSCENTTMRMLRQYNLNVYCNATDACVNAKISEVGTLIAYQENAVNGASIQCLPDRGCSIYCIDPLSCNQADIDGTNSAQLDVHCRQHESCLDLTIRCPPGAKNGAFCQIIGDPDNQIDVHSNFTIYAPNGWNDIRFTDYTAYTLDGKLYCGGNDSFLIDGLQQLGLQECDIEYGVWDCKNTSSPCRNQSWMSLDRETYICDGTTNSCDDQEIVCNDASNEYYRYVVPVCNLLCVGDNTCQNLNFSCDLDKQCNVVCAGDGSCNGLIVDWKDRQGLQSQKYPMNIICGKDGNDGACQNGNFSAPLRDAGYGFAMNVHSFGSNGLKGTKVYGPSTRYPVYVQCNFNQSCQGAYFYAAFFSSLELVIQCNGEYDSCADMTVYCPLRGLCQIRGESIDRNRNLHLFCENGWDDIDVSQWNNAQILYTINLNQTLPPTLNTTQLPLLNTTEFLPVNDTNLTITTMIPLNTTTTTTTNAPIGGINFNIMHCGTDYGNPYNYTCEINDAFNCTCPPVTTSTTTTTTTTVEPTPSPTRPPLTAGETYPPTEDPTVQPTMSPTVGAALNQTTKPPQGGGSDGVDEAWYITAITFICLFAVTGCVLLYFAWVFWRADEKATQGGYHKADVEEVEEIEAGDLGDTR